MCPLPRQLLKPGVITSLRFCFAFFDINECDRDVSTAKKSSYHLLLHYWTAK
jgi:hypothetical protein